MLIIERSSTLFSENFQYLCSRFQANYLKIENYVWCAMTWKVLVLQNFGKQKKTNLLMKNIFFYNSISSAVIDVRGISRIRATKNYKNKCIYI